MLLFDLLHEASSYNTHVKLIGSKTVEFGHSYITYGSENIF